MQTFPNMFRVRQKFDRTKVNDVAAAIREQFSVAKVATIIKPGESVALAVGSRGIANLALIVRTAVDACKTIGAKPFILPAMGSHGGGTAEGQRKVLEGFGVTESAMGCPICSQMDTEVICRSPEGIPVHIDRLALSANHVIIINRIKPHTRFVGPVESGLMKMLLIGLGKKNGATIYHQAIQTLSFPQIIASVADEVLRRCPVRFGLAIVENSHDETAHVELVAANAFTNREPQLLELAKRWLPRLPFDHADLLIVDRIGKEISGSGMDTNVVGRKFNDRQAIGDEKPNIHLIYVRGLTAATHGNASGIGIAEICHARAVKAMDKSKTWINAITAGHLAAGMIPLHWDTDLEALLAAAGQCGLTPIEQAAWIWIPNTLHLEELLCSEVFLAEARKNDGLEVLTDPQPIALDAHGQLIEVFP